MTGCQDSDFFSSLSIKTMNSQPNAACGVWRVHCAPLAVCTYIHMLQMQCECSASASNLSAWISKGQPSPALSLPLIYITKQAESQWQTVIGDVRGQEFDCQAEWDWRMDGERGSKRRADGGKEDGVCDKHDLMAPKRK